MNSKSKLTDSVKLYKTAPHDCSYIAGKQAATVFVDPELNIDISLNSTLSEMGYRRSGAHLYRPDCEDCQACISCRIPVLKFSASRRFRKVIKANADLTIVETTEVDNAEMYPLYSKYINTRHKDGDMYPATPEQFQAFICTNAKDTRFYKFYQGDELVAVAVTDVLEHGLSAVYTFFDPDQSKRSLGNFVILWLIQQAIQMSLSYVFLGYWIKDCPKMEYKNNFRPLELYLGGNWLLVK